MRTLGISGALKAPSAGSLISSALRLPSNVDWSNQSGVEYLPEACGIAERFLYCDDEDPSKVDPVVPEPLQFRPFVIYYPEGCSPLSISPEDWETRAQHGLTAHESAALALELTISEGAVNPSLTSTAVDVSPVTPNRIPQTLLGLIHSMTDCGYHGDITFIAPAWALPIFLQENLLTLSNGVYKVGHHTVIFDAGFPNFPPLLGADPTDGQVWIYAVGPIEYALGEVVSYGVAESKKGASARMNSVYVIAERPAIVRFDTCCVFAALAEVCQ